MTETNMAPAAGATLLDKLQAIIAEQRAFWSVDEDGSAMEDYQPVTPADVAAALYYGVEHRDWNRQEELDAILLRLAELVFVELNLADPWPELTRQHLAFLIADRKGKAPDHRLTGLVDRSQMEAQQPLALTEKLLAHRHRAWLEKDLDKKLAKLAKAKATVAALEGRAA